MNQEIRNQLNELHQRLAIDPFDLENECVHQPALYAEVGELATEARSVAKSSKDRLDYVHADLSFKIRKEPGKYGVEKVTESSVETAVIIQPEYQQASTAYIDAQRIADAFGVLQTSLEQRKSMLKDLVTLFVYSYYSSKQEMGQEKRQVNEVDSAVTKDDIMKRRAELAAQRGRRSDDRGEVETEQE